MVRSGQKYDMCPVPEIPLFLLAIGLCVNLLELDKKNSLS